MLETESPNVDLQLIKFTAADRCDACSAQAYSMATRDDVPSELLFCLHHRKKHFSALLDSGWSVIDDYEAAEQLAVKESVNI